MDSNSYCIRPFQGWRKIMYRKHMAQWTLHNMIAITIRCLATQKGGPSFVNFLTGYSRLPLLCPSYISNHSRCSCFPEICCNFSFIGDATSVAPYYGFFSFLIFVFEEENHCLPWTVVLWFAKQMKCTKATTGKTSISSCFNTINVFLETPVDLRVPKSTDCSSNCLISKFWPGFLTSTVSPSLTKLCKYPLSGRSFPCSANLMPHISGGLWVGRISTYFGEGVISQERWQAIYASSLPSWTRSSLQHLLADKVAQEINKWKTQIHAGWLPLPPLPLCFRTIAVERYLWWEKFRGQHFWVAVGGVPTKPTRLHSPHSPFPATLQACLELDAGKAQQSLKVW